MSNSDDFSPPSTSKDEPSFFFADPSERMTLPLFLTWTESTPTDETIRSNEWISSGKSMKFDAVASSRPSVFANEPPRSIAPMISAEIDSKRSAPRPAQSPTLSPTRSAITAGLRGSSSGIPASTLPTMSAPTSAAFV